MTTATRIYSPINTFFVAARPNSLRYRKHLILLTINQDEFTGAWVGSLHIQYTEKLKFRNVLIQAVYFGLKTEAEKHLIQEAKEWIDSRLRSEDGNS